MVYGLTMVTMVDNGLKMFDMVYGLFIYFLFLYFVKIFWVRLLVRKIHPDII